MTQRIEHASQGQTLGKGAVVDLRLGRGTSIIASYVAVTRVKRRQDLLIYRPFGKNIFSRGQRKGPPELLEHLRGNHVDWESLQEEYLPRGRCSHCGFMHYKEDFHLHQWSRGNGKGTCKTCMRELLAQAPLQCVKCLYWKSEESYPNAQRNYRSSGTRVCLDCTKKRRCQECKELREKDAFTASEWQMANHKRKRCRGKCKKCMSRGHQEKPCYKCKQTLAEEAFGQRMWRLGDTERCCKKCMSRDHQEKPCCACKETLTEEAFGQRMWRAGDTERRCKTCQRRHRGQWSCVQCKGVFDVSEFNRWLATRTQRKNDGVARCNTRFAGQRENERKLVLESLSQVQQLPDTCHSNANDTCRRTKRLPVGPAAATEAKKARTQKSLQDTKKLTRSLGQSNTIAERCDVEQTWAVRKRRRE